MKNCRKFSQSHYLCILFACISAFIFAATAFVLSTRRDGERIQIAAPAEEGALAGIAADEADASHAEYVELNSPIEGASIEAERTEIDAPSEENGDISELNGGEADSLEARYGELNSQTESAGIGGRAVFRLFEPSRISLMICLPEARRNEIPAQFYARCAAEKKDCADAPKDAADRSKRCDSAGSCEIRAISGDNFSSLNAPSVRIDPIEPRLLILPAQFAARYDSEILQYCSIDVMPATVGYKDVGNSEPNSDIGNCAGTMCDATHNAIDFIVSAPEGALVAAAVSPVRGARVALILWALFALSLYAAVAAAVKSRATRIDAQTNGDNSPDPQPEQEFRFDLRDRSMIYGRFDGIAAFVLSMFASYGVAKATFLIFPSKTTLFPEFYATVALMLCNFVAFISVYLVIRLFRHFCPLRAERIRGHCQTAPAAEYRAQAAELHEQTDTSNGCKEKVSSLHEITENSENAKGTSHKRWKHVLPSKILSFYERICKAERRHPLKFALYGGALLACFAAVASIFCPLPGLTPVELSSRLTASSAMLGFSVLLAAVAEESIFRGVIQGSLSACTGARHPRIQNAFAIVLTTLIFVSVHVPQSAEHLWALIPIALFSLTACQLRHATGSILPPIALHMTYNGCLVLPSILSIL